MSTPEILYQNLLKVAQLGRGDGTIYATATSAAVDQDAKTFTLSGLSIMDDLGADVNDKFSGYILSFPVSERSYLITDWVAAGDVATVFEFPNVTDTTACEIRRTLYTDDFNVDSPIRYGSNGQLEKKWIDKTANNTASIVAAAPNGVDDGGFESGTLNEWTTSIDGNGAITVNSAGLVLGTYNCLINMGTTATEGTISQSGKIDLEVGKTYGIIFKAFNTGIGVEEDELSVELVYSSGATTYIDVTFSKINLNDNIADVGGGTDNSWHPDADDTWSWDEVTFIAPDNIDAGEWKLLITWSETDSRDDLYIDEIYIWEIAPTPSDGSIPNPNTLIIAGHNMAGGFVDASRILGQRVQGDLTNFSTDDWDQLLDLDVDVQVDGASPIYETFTASTVIFPIIGIQFWAVSGKTWEAAEIWIGERWVWDQFLSGDWEPVDQDIMVASSLTIGGHKRVSERYRQRLRGGTISTLDLDEVAEWEAFIAEAGLSKPFWYFIAAIPDLGLASEIIFMRNRSTPRLPMNADRFRLAVYDFEEVL